MLAQTKTFQRPYKIFFLLQILLQEKERKGGITTFLYKKSFAPFIQYTYVSFIMGARIDVKFFFFVENSNVFSVMLFLKVFL